MGMTHEEAIRIIEKEIHIDVRQCTHEDACRFEDALRMAISALRYGDSKYVLLSAPPADAQYIDTGVPYTNADHIRSMTDEELAVFLHTSFSCYGCPARTVCDSADLDCDDIVTDWLKQPYKEA